MVNIDDETEMGLHQGNQHAHQLTGVTTQAVGECDELGFSVTKFFNNPYYLELVDQNKLTDDKINIESLETINKNMTTIGGICEIHENEMMTNNSTQLKDNKSILDETITNFKNSKKIKSILTFLDNNGSISSIVFIYNENPNNKQYYHKPRVIGTLPYNHIGNLTSSAEENYDTYYRNKPNNLVKLIVHSINDMLDLQTEDVDKQFDTSLNSLLNDLYYDGELPPSSVKYNIIPKNEFIYSIKLSANSFTSEMIINTDKGNVIKLGKLTDDIPSTEYTVEDGDKNIYDWIKKFFRPLTDPDGFSQWKPASITNSEEHRKASEAMDKFINDRGGTSKTVLVGATRSKKGKYSYCKPDNAGYCFQWIDGSKWLDNIWYQDNVINKEPNDSGRGQRGGGESAVHMWDAREQGTNLRTLNDINYYTRGAILLKRTQLNNTETFESQDIGNTQQIVDINITAININNIKNLKNNDFVITEKKTEIEEEKDSKFRDPLKKTSKMVTDLKSTIYNICNTSNTAVDGKISMVKQASDTSTAIRDIEKNTDLRIVAALKVKGLEGGVEPFSNMYEGSNNLKMSLFFLIIYAIIIFLILKIINNSYLRNIFILITILLFIIIINLYNSNNIENFSNLKNNILFDSINNIALKVKNIYSY